MAATKRQIWFYGLFSGFITGAATALEACIALLVVDNKTFNLHENLGKTLLTCCAIGFLSGARCAFAYLKTSPLPPLEDEIKPGS